MNSKAFFIIFKGLLLKQIKQNFLEGEILTLSNTDSLIIPMILSFYLVMKLLIIANDSVVKVQNLVMNDKS